MVVVDLGSKGFSGAPEIIDKMRNIAQVNADGMQTHVTGPAGNAADSGKAFNGIDSTLLYAALGVVIVLLLLTYRSPVLWILPVIAAGTALICAQAIIYLLAKHSGLTVNAESAGILTVLVFGAATDYALLLISRYREELHNHADRHGAMALALRRVGPAIIASALTVAVGMLCLLVAELNSTRGLGPVAAIGIGTGLLVMVTLLPALLVVFGRWIFWPMVPRYGMEIPSSRGFWAVIGRRIAQRPRVVWAATTLVLAALATGIFGLKADGISIKNSYRTTPDSVIGSEVLARHFPTLGTGEPVVIVGNAAAASELGYVVAHTAGVAAVAPPIVKDGSVLLQATLKDAPDSDAAATTIDHLRGAVHAVIGADAKVGGATAVNLDTERASQHDRKVVIPLMLAVVVIILAVVLRSLIAPGLLVLTVVLSFAATMGLCAVIFNHVFKFGGGDSSFPLFVFMFLVALGIDYNIFLMTRVREEARRFGTKEGALRGLATTGAVITSAGMVLAGTFAVLATLPLTIFVEIGFAVALGVLIDTLVVRSVLVTALTLDVGCWMWWPSRLSRKS
jgi:RND superfamily putative drug exporter